MFLHLGGSTVVSKREIIAILDVETKKLPITQEFLEIATDEGFIKTIVPKEKAKSFIITNDQIFLSPISCTTLKKRSNSFSGISEKVFSTEP
ncbi:MAG: DUF370 domain-containing protein [Firmicutes bacterium]|nr:DUF370 domain-containing protein [Bacillota bacterium]